MRYIISAVPETGDDLDNPLAGVWEVEPIERDPSLVDLLSVAYPDDSPAAG
jgi:hypothetical protein